MNVYEISYQAALAGEYGERVMHTDPFARYFDRVGARVHRQYGDPELELNSDHLQNIVNLIYSGRKHGIDEIVLRLDDDEAQKEIEQHYYAVDFLPEVIANLDIVSDPFVLTTTFSEGKGTPGYRSSEPEPEMPDFDQLCAEVEQERDREQKFGKREINSMRALCEAAVNGSYRAVKLPTWIIDKYKLSGDDAKPGKKFGDAMVELAKIFPRRPD